ncbi:RrF2 family transcriptional regulator [Achromobacter aloeverae]|uniref:Rrf2 family transcriptional regulator n=1 Tax=Achromobacter aloeverae TaxID=1750518 RepID=A0A4Q1HK90_9BURK|nr:Rrf2 family transcriptional regulator [Achromobacter aloeverae]RXN88153.1 Rrf2 family transcriptional regulator [Achromobacter aloeverae]
MRLTDYTDYSLRALIYVASHPDESVTIQHIADAYGIPRNHLIKIVQKLGQAGFLRTTRGRAGGLRLGRPAGEILIGDVVRTTESDFAMVECFHDDNRCVITRACVLKGLLQRALQAWFAVLDGVTLHDLVDKPATLNRAFAQALALNDVRDTLRKAAAPAKALTPPGKGGARRQAGT